jgi:hypothetical protein
MKERQPGCICELDDYGDPLVVHYPLCPVHKPDALTPKDTAKTLLAEVYKTHSGLPVEDAKAFCFLIVNEMLDILDAFQTHEYAKVLIPYYNQVKEEINNL